MNLHPDDAIGSDVLFGFCLVGGLHAVNPRLDTVAVGFDDVIVPVVWFEGGSEFFDVGLCHDAVAATFVVNRSVPVWFTKITLIARHFVAAENPL